MKLPGRNQQLPHKTDIVWLDLPDKMWLKPAYVLFVIGILVTE